MCVCVCVSKRENLNEKRPHWRTSQAKQTNNSLKLCATITGSTEPTILTVIIWEILPIFYSDNVSVPVSEIIEFNSSEILWYFNEMLLKFVVSWNRYALTVLFNGFFTITYRLISCRWKTLTWNKFKRIN